MRIVYKDGSVLTGNKIEIIGDTIYFDDYRYVSVWDVDCIEED